ncbi:hypothetical protein RI054_31g123440 [Pseudoscourfieldia marina]
MRGRSLVLSLVLLALMLLSEMAHASSTTTSRDVPAAAPLKTIVMSRDITAETRREQRRLLFAQGGDGGGGYALPRSLSGGGGGAVLPLLALWDISPQKPALLIALWTARFFEFIFAGLSPLFPFSAVTPIVITRNN